MWPWGPIWSCLAPSRNAPRLGTAQRAGAAPDGRRAAPPRVRVAVGWPVSLHLRRRLRGASRCSSRAAGCRWPGRPGVRGRARRRHADGSVGAWLVRAAAARSSRARIVAVATRCRITLLRVAPTPSGGGQQVPACQPAGWLVSLLGEADVRVEHGEQGAREAGGRPPAARPSWPHHGAPGPGNAPAPAWRYRAGPRTGRPGSPWQTHPYGHPRHVPQPAPIGQGRQLFLGRGRS